MDDDTLLPFSLPAVRRKKVAVAFDGGRLSSDGGVLLLREVERRPGLAERLAGCLVDRRDPSRIEHEIVEMLRLRMFAIAAGYEDADDCDSSRAAQAMTWATRTVRPMCEAVHRQGALHALPFAVDPKEGRIIPNARSRRGEVTMRKSGRTNNHLESASLGELWRDIAGVRVSVLMSILSAFVIYTVMMHDLGVRDEMSATAVSTGYPFDMKLTLPEHNSEALSLKGIYFLIPQDWPHQKGKAALRVLQAGDDGEPTPIGFAQVDADDRPNVTWSRFVKEGVISLVAPAQAQEAFKWAGHERRRDYYERVSTDNTVRRYYSDGWVLEYRVDERGFVINQTLRWVRGP